MIEVAEMSLAKANRQLAESFLALGGRADVTAAVLDEFDRTRRMVLAAMDQSELLERKPQLGTAVALRAPYIDALSHLQLRALRLLRAPRPADVAAVPHGGVVPHGRVVPDGGAAAGDAAAAAHVRDAWGKVLLLTVNGAAAGLQNTG
jgi:phosphoenolpyruvate carboxylase